MPLSRGQRAAIKRAITRFEDAVIDAVYREAVSRSQIDGENAAVREYARSRECLEALIEKYAP